MCVCVRIYVHVCVWQKTKKDQRMEDLLYEKLDRRKKERVTQYEILGTNMVEAGNDFGPGTSYGELYIIFCLLSTVYLYYVCTYSLTSEVFVASNHICFLYLLNVLYCTGGLDGLKFQLRIVT